MFRRAVGEKYYRCVMKSVSCETGHCLVCIIIAVSVGTYDAMSTNDNDFGVLQ